MGWLSTPFGNFLCCYFVEKLSKFRATRKKDYYRINIIFGIWESHCNVCHTMINTVPIDRFANFFISHLISIVVDANEQNRQTGVRMFYLNRFFMSNRPKLLMLCFLFIYSPEWSSAVCFHCSSLSPLLLSPLLQHTI